MTRNIIVILIASAICVENGLLKVNYVSIPKFVEKSQPHSHEEGSNDKIVALQNYDESEEYEVSAEKQMKETTKKPCVIVVLSNMQNPSIQSLLRKYRYDENGVLIPSSVKYFIKMPQEPSSSPLLVPLSDKAFSPQGGFIRYYKEVPPIPLLW